MQKFNKSGNAGNWQVAIVFIFMLIFLGIGIISGVKIFYSSEYDARQAQANLIAERLAECIIREGYSNNIFDNLYQICDINQDSINEHKIIFKICDFAISSSNCLRENNPLKVAGSNFESCYFSGTKSNQNFPICSEKTIESNGKKLTIITGSNQRGIRR